MNGVHNTTFPVPQVRVLVAFNTGRVVTPSNSVRPAPSTTETTTN